MRRLLGRSVAIVLAVCLSASVVSAGSPPPSPANVTASEDPTPAAVLSFGEAVVRNVDGWRETGRTSGAQADGRIASLGAPAVLGDRLVSVGKLCEPDGGTCEAVGWTSADGLEWTAVRTPGDAPTVDTTAFAPSRMIALGHVGADDPRGAAWVTTDGLAWTMAPAVPPRFVRDAAATDEAIVVLAMKRLWTSANGSAWNEIEGPQNVLGVESGPGGFIAWTGGRVSKDVYVPAQAWRSTDGTEWTQMKLPGRLGDLEPYRASLDFIPLEDEWVMAPPDRTLKRSPDGLAWEQAPAKSQRFEYPMHWIVRIDGRYHAFGEFYPAMGMWSWRWDRRDRPDNLWIDEVLYRPIEWRGELISLGEIDPDRGSPIQTAWRWEGMPWIPGLEAFGLEELARNPFKTGWGESSDLITTDRGLVALGSWGDWRVTKGAAWSSPDGRSWARTHLLPRGTHLVTGIALGDGSLLAFGERGDPETGRHQGTWTWRLEADGSASQARRLPGQATCCQVPVEVVGTPGTGMVALLGEDLEVIVKQPGRRWAAAELTGTADQTSVGLVETRSGFVVVANGPDGVTAWRSEDGEVWRGPELLPKSQTRHDRREFAASQDLVYDPEQDVLLVLGYPDRVWRSEAGEPFEAVGPLAVALSDPRANDGVHRGVALSDGFLVATTDSPLGIGQSRLQMSSDGRTWTPAPPMRAALGERELLVDGDRLLYFGGVPQIVAGPTVIAEYPTWPVDVIP